MFNFLGKRKGNTLGGKISPRNVFSNTNALIKGVDE